MARNGAGTYVLPAGNPTADGVTLTAALWNTTFSDIATALTNSLAADGQTTVTADLNFNEHLLRNIGAGVSQKDVLQAQQVQSGEALRVGSVAGTSTAYTGSLPYGTPTLTAGMIILFAPHLTNGASPTLALNGGLAKEIVGYDGEHLLGAEMTASLYQMLQYTGSVWRPVTLFGTEGVPMYGIMPTAFTCQSTLSVLGVATFSDGLNATGGIAVTGQQTVSNSTDDTPTAHFYTLARGAGHSQGLQVSAGTNTADWMLKVRNQAGTVVGLQVDGAGRVFGGALHNNADAPTGATNQYIASGTYTPTLATGTNTTATGSPIGKWVRVGNCVVVHFQGSWTATASGTVTTGGVSLPITSNLTAATDLTGTGAVTPGAAGAAVSCVGDTTNDRATIAWWPTVTGAQTVYGTFQYEVKA